MDGLLVGRDAECAALHSRLAVSRAGPVPVVLVTGEAGAGKTTLVEHVLATTSTPVLRGRAAAWACPAYEVVASALRPAVRGAAGPLPAVLAQVMPELGTLRAEPSPAALAAAVCSVLAAAAGGRAVALFLDDLQWADEASLDLLPALADAARGLPVALVGCYRSDELPRGHRLRAVRALLRRNHQLAEIELGPLGDDDVKQMLTGLLGAVPQPALATVVAGRADGLPFAVEELAFALRDGGRLAYRNGGVTLTGAGTAPVPDGIREAVLLRASRLTGQERALLEAAAVAGIDFDVDIVLAAAGTTAWPDGFTGSGLLTEARDGRAAFRHPLTQEAAYSDIPWSRRRRLHRALASTLAGHDAAPALIAAHHLAARDFGPARRALLAAAEEHYEVHAYRDAARALRTALEHWPSGEQDDSRLAVIDRLARCAEMCSEYADAVMLLRELADGHERRGDSHALASTYRRLALAHELRGQWESALTAREAAAVAFSAAGIPAEAAIDRLAMAAHLRSAASFSAALATLSAAAADAQASGRTDLQLRIQGLRGNVLSRLGRPREGIAALRGALDQALAGSLPDTAAELQQRLADALEHSGDYRAATAAYAAAYQYCDAHGADAVGQLCRACASVVLFARGEWDRTVSVCQDVLASDAAPHARAVGAGLLGLVHAMRGAARLARPHLLESNLTATRGETLLADQPQAAAQELRRAAEMFSQLGLPLQVAQAQRRAASAATQLGEHARARELLHAAHAAAGQLGARHLRDSCAAALRQLGDKPRRRPSSRRVAAGLTSREMDVMHLVAQGNTSRQIGSALFISPRTVEMHVHSSMHKLQCRTRAEAVRRLTELQALPRPGTARPEPV